MALTLAGLLPVQAGLADLSHHTLAARQEPHVQLAVHPEFPSTAVPWFVSGANVENDWYEILLRPLSVSDPAQESVSVELVAILSGHGPKVFARFASLDDLMAGFERYLLDSHLKAIRHSLLAGQTTGIGGHFHATCVFNAEQLSAILRRATHVS
jgi:hypothetical protein